jgi:hypothetical protein
MTTRATTAMATIITSETGDLDVDPVLALEPVGSAAVVTGCAVDDIIVLQTRSDVAVSGDVSMLPMHADAHLYTLC